MSIDNASYPKLLIIRGLPGSGKTSLAASIQHTLGDQVVVLDPDSIDQSNPEYAAFSQKLNSQGIDPKIHLYRFSRAKAHQAIEDHKTVIWNQPFTNLEGLQKTIANLQQYATEHDTTLPVQLVELEIDPVIAKQRIDERKAQGGHGPSDDTFKTRFLDIYQSFKNEGYPTLIISGTGNVTDATTQVINALNVL